MDVRWWGIGWLVLLLLGGELRGDDSPDPVVAQRPGENVSDRPMELQSGELVANLEFQTPEGTIRRLSEYRGDYVLVDVWATWCAPCIIALPGLEKLHRERGDRLTILGLNIDENPARVRVFLAERKLPWAQGITGKPESVLAQLRIPTIPAYLLIDPEGRLVQRAQRIADLQRALERLPPRESR